MTPDDIIRSLKEEPENWFPSDINKVIRIWIPLVSLIDRLRLRLAIWRWKRLQRTLMSRPKENDMQNKILNILRIPTIRASRYQMTKKKIGEIGVDAGLCWIGDPCYIFHQNKLPSTLGKDWPEFCNLVGQNERPYEE